MKKEFKIINGDSLEELKKFPDNYFDSVVSDPPYGLGREPDANEMLKAWVETGYMEVKGKGFMNREWDSFVPQPLFWKEVYRVLKHGGHLAAFFGTRTYDWGCMAIRLAGFEIRDSIQFAFDDSKYRDEFINSLTNEQRIVLGQILKNGENIALWNYGSGFPKSLNVSKAIDKMYGAEREVIGKNNYSMPKADNSIGENSYGISGGKLANGTTAERITADITAPATEQAKQWEGWGSALKPAVEPIVLARKPLEKGLSIAENVLKWGTGALNIDGCRIVLPKDDAQVKLRDGKTIRANGINDVYSNGVGKIEGDYFNANGRFPANLILSHHPACEFKGMKKVKGSNCSPDDIGKGRDGSFTNGIYGEKSSKITVSHTDENGEETVEDWNCHEDCPINIMDEQSGESKSQRSERGNIIGNNVFGKYNEQDNTTRGHNDTGGASRFFYTAKASKSERNFGLGGFEEKRKSAYGYDLGLGNAGEGMFKDRNTLKLNIHPTVKPLKLMQYLARLITPPNGKVLDPFNGSGTTGIACMLEGFEYTGIELDAEYCKISEARINAWSELEEYEDYKKVIERDNKEEEQGNNQLNLFD